MELFQEIRRCCSGLREVDTRSISQEIVTAVRMQVGAEVLADIPRIINFKSGEDIFMHVIEVEHPVRKSQGDVSSV